MLALGLIRFLKCHSVPHTEVRSKKPRLHACIPRGCVGSGSGEPDACVQSAPLRFGHRLHVHVKVHISKYIMRSGLIGLSIFSFSLCPTPLSINQGRGIARCLCPDATRARVVRFDAVRSGVHRTRSQMRCRCGHGSGDSDHPPHWIRESNVGPRERSGTARILARFWPGRDRPGGRAFLVSAPTRVVTGVGVGPKGQCVCPLLRVLM